MVPQISNASEHASEVHVPIQGDVIPEEHKEDGTGPSSAASMSADCPTQSSTRRWTCGLSKTTILKLSLVLLIVSGIIVGLTVGNLVDRIRDLLEWLEDNRIEGIAIFIAVYTSLTAVFFPSSLLTLAGGTIYSWWGIPIVWFSACLGQSAAFFIARYLLRDFVERWASKYALWKGVNEAIRRHALQVTILVRLAAVVPYSATNALLPLTSLTFWQYTIGSAVGILPGVGLFVGVGRLASSIAAVSTGGMESNGSSTVLIVSVAVSIVVLLILVVLLSRYAKKALRERIDEVNAEEGIDANEATSTDTSSDEREKQISIPVAADNVREESAGISWDT